MQNTIGAGAFKTQCLQLIDQVAETHKPLIITKHGKAIATLITEDRALLEYGRLGYLKTQQASK